ncbi:hypothetical protein [Caudoviricetes sp.]|nr:hypothetical protein [Caudoviricetes sp.]
MAFDKQCQFCLVRVNVWVDGKTVQGPWAIMCKACWVEQGLGLGTGIGQMYVQGIKVRLGERMALL